jgi:hypothetical protein
VYQHCPQAGYRLVLARRARLTRLLELSLLKSSIPVTVLSCHVRLQAALPFLCPGHGPVLQDKAAQLLRALHQVDGDAVWLLLFDTLQNSPEGVDDALLPTTDELLHGVLEGSPPPHPLLPSVSSLLPPLHGHGRQQSRGPGRLQSHAEARGLSVSVSAMNAGSGARGAGVSPPAWSPAASLNPPVPGPLPSPGAQPPTSTPRTQAAGTGDTASRRGSMSGGGGRPMSSSAPGAGEWAPLPPPSALVPSSRSSAAWVVTPQLAAACHHPAAALLAELTAASG